MTQEGHDDATLPSRAPLVVFAAACLVAVVALAAVRLASGDEVAAAATALASADDDESEQEGGGTASESDDGETASWSAPVELATAEPDVSIANAPPVVAERRDELRGRARPKAIDRELARRADARIDAALSCALSLGGGKVGPGDLEVSVRCIDLSSGAVVYERAPDASLAPASNLKLVTSLAALELLDVDWRFVTRVEAPSAPSGGRVLGDLVVRAGGDPLYSHDDPGHAEERIDRLARDVAAAGVREVTGALVLDLGDFTDAGPAPGWPRPEGDWTASYALVSGFTVQGGQLHARIETASAGNRARVALRPAPTGLAETFALDTVGDSTHDVRIGVVDARRTVSITGRIGARYGSFERTFRHPAPHEHFAAVLEAALARHGVRIAGGRRFARNAPAGLEIARLESPWLDLLRPINTHSVNAVSDALLLALGRQHGGSPTREAGARAVVDALARLGVDSRGLVQVDGSGLSRDNRATVVHLTELLAAAAARPGPRRDALLDSLAVAGRTGTLSDRMSGTPAAGRVRAKTGFLRGASALSGLATAPDGRELAFSIIVRYPALDGWNDRCWKPMQDDLVLAFIGVERGRVR